MLILKNGTRLKSLKHREKHITQQDIKKRDEVLSVDYSKYNYDLIVLNDHKDETINKAIIKIQEELELETIEKKEENTTKQKRKKFIQKISNKVGDKEKKLEFTHNKDKEESKKDSMEEEMLE